MRLRPYFPVFGGTNEYAEHGINAYVWTHEVTMRSLGPGSVRRWSPATTRRDA